MLLFALIAIGGLIILAFVGLVGFLVLLKLGVIVRESQRPRYQDFGTYTIDQGREVRPEEEQAARERVR